jgi:hypothetical protein
MGRLTTLVTRQGPVFQNLLDGISMDPGFVGYLSQSQLFFIPHPADFDVIFHDFHLAFSSNTTGLNNCYRSLFKPVVSDPQGGTDPVSPYRLPVHF